MSDATCKTCPRWFHTTLAHLDGTLQLNRAECRHGAPIVGLPWQDHYPGAWPEVGPDDWCGEHPDRQIIEYTEATLVTHDDDGPTAADMRRIVDALEKMASRAKRAVA